MASDNDVRALFAVAPADYVTERTRLAKQARTDGDKARAASIQALKRPTVAMWGVLAAGADTKAVHRVVETTNALADVQASGGDGTSLAEAVGRRRAAVGVIVESAISELARWDVDARGRRQEMRDIVDQLARRSDLTESWIDGTLRELPEQSVGFDAFANHEVVSRLHIVPSVAPPPEPLPATLSKTSFDEEPREATPAVVDDLAVRRAANRRQTDAAQTEADKAVARDRAIREQATRDRAQKELEERLALIDNAARLADEADTELVASAARLADVRAALHEAEASVRSAEAAHAAAEQRRYAALAVVDSLRRG
jgi:hypothetical protein